MSKGEDELAFQLKAYSIPFTREYKFHPTRKWRADFHIKPDILIEVDGGVFVQGRHSGGMGQVHDMNKHNAAVLLGFRVLRFEPSKHIKTGQAIDIIRMIYEQEDGSGGESKAARER